MTKFYNYQLNVNFKKYFLKIQLLKRVAINFNFKSFFWNNFFIIKYENIFNTKMFIYCIQYFQKKFIYYKLSLD